VLIATLVFIVAVVLAAVTILSRLLAVYIVCPSLRFTLLFSPST
jgi:hypothetical protein